MATERAYWLAWSQVAGIGPVLIKRLFDYFGRLESAWEANFESLVRVDGIGDYLAKQMLQARDAIQPDLLLRQHEAQYPQFWTPADASYPRLLLEIPDPPPVLYYRGQPQVANSQGAMAAIALVGTRSPSEYGKRWTRRLTHRLVEQGFTIVSGLAEGIDKEAHTTCLHHQGRTIAVLGTGVDVVYPYSNRALYEQIPETGLLLSEYPDGTGPDRTHFPRRNRIIAGLSRAIIVTEAPERSGALITAKLANDYGRDVYALPGALDNPRCRGCLDLISQGSQIIVSEDALLNTLGALPPVHQLSLLDAIASMPSVAPELQPILQAVPTTDAIALDALVQQLDLATGSVLGALVQLELLGLVTQLPGMHYQRSPEGV